ncbi:MAG: hydrogenobyrinic acid a,c-diamide synthase (glutamine-hydrolyzing) [Gammaproteobacteria bacterium]|nr:hydrogenobyrinic acid a,c-diamide synthase (glutamine-hydrolyzing) [Gammaproteobacteria bacterium]
MSHVLISAAHKSSGKTTISMGLCAALQAQGKIVQPFKKGPDYIDPMWLAQASGRNCYNLDYHTMGKEELRGTFRRYMAGADIGIIEGNKGLYDGLDLEGRNSNAALARLLKAPVVLVISAKGMTRGIAPLILGYQAFDERVNIAGVILNKLGGKRHEGKLRAVIEHYTDVPVIGAVHEHADLNIDERHLGLIPSNESRLSTETIQRIASHVGDQVDLGRLMEIAALAPDVDTGKYLKLVSNAKTDVRIGVARDAAFGFYYPNDLEALQAAGAELVFFDALHDRSLPEVDGLFIGGGFPETQAKQLAANRELKQQIRREIEDGMPVYAECGGLMYLSRVLKWRDESHEMCGALGLDTVMYDKPQGRGYVRVSESEDFPWQDNRTENNAVYCAHEFHYSKAENIDEDIRFGYKMMRGFGVDGAHDGVIYKNTFASYTHLRDSEHNRWASRFVQFVRKHKGGSAKRHANNADQRHQSL